MAKKSQIQKSKRKVKFSTREKKRCFKRSFWKRKRPVGSGKGLIDDSKTEVL